MFDLKQIKKDLEQKYDVTFTEDKYLDMDNLHYEIKRKSLDIHIDRYTTTDWRHGMEFIGADFYDKSIQYGRSGPHDSMEELIRFLDSIKLPRRTTIKEEYEQISLF